MKLRVKIVPDSLPNAKGRWITCTVRGMSKQARRVSDTLELINKHLPDGFHAVAYRRPIRT